MQVLKKIRSFSNCIFSASLWTNGEKYFAICCWVGDKDECKEIGEGKDGEVVKVYELEPTSQEEAIQAFVGVVQTLRKCGRYATY